MTANEHVVKAEPTDGISLNNLAWLYYTQGDERALETARKAQAAMPGNGSVLDTLGWILVEAGELEEGISVLTNAVERSDAHPTVRYHLAEGYARSGDTDAAKAILTEILANSENFDGRSDAERLLGEL